MPGTGGRVHRDTQWQALPQIKYWGRIKWVTRACKSQTSIIIKEGGMITKNKNSNSNSNSNSNKNREKPTASKIINQHEKTGQDN
jgi:hypothetical protein